MKGVEWKKVQTNNLTKQPVRTPRKESKTGEVNGRKSVTKVTQSKVTRSRSVSNSVASDTSVGREPFDVYEDVVIHYVNGAFQGRNDHKVADERKDVQLGKGQDSDYEYVKDSSSSHGSSLTVDDEKIEREDVFSRLTSPRASRVKIDYERSKSNVKQPHTTLKKPLTSNNAKVLVKDSKSSSLKERNILEKPMEKLKDEDVFEEVSNGGKSTEGDYEYVAMKQKAEIMENRVKKLEEELREVAALEISLYSVIPEHGSSAHKVHTPARRLSRLYLHACKHWTRSKRATVARNTVSGIILVTKTCGNDLSRLTFWLTNTVVLREIISQALGVSCHTNSARFMEAMASQSFEDWEETSTFILALEKIESWIFFRVVESVWWQAFAPNMLSAVEELISQRSINKLLGTPLGDQQPGTFPIELWKTAFQTAFQRLCPVRAAGHECGCLPVLARMVMKQCIARLDVAMFNAILRESANQIPTDPVSDPIVDSRVLPITAGEFSFGSGALLKNAIGNWCMWFEHMLGIETGQLSKDRDTEANDDDHHRVQGKTECFRLLNELSDLLMLPKDMLMDNSIREEVCPSINLDVLKRILCYFTPDEFCPDEIPGEVLESLNTESFEDRKLAGLSARCFPYTAATILYCPPSANDVSEKIAEAGGKPHLDRNVSMVQKRGYTSDDDLDDLDSPLTSLIEPASPSTSLNGNSSIKDTETTSYGGNARYELLRQVWSL